MGLLIFLFTGAQSTFQNFVSGYAASAGGFTDADAVLVAAVFGSTFTAGRVLSIPLSTKLSARAMIRRPCEKNTWFSAPHLGARPKRPFC